MPGTVPYRSRPLFYRKLTKEIMGSPSASLPGLANFTLSVECLSPYGLMKTLRELGAASSTLWHPYALWKLSRYPWNQQGSGKLKIVKISVLLALWERFVKATDRVSTWCLAIHLFILRSPTVMRLNSVDIRMICSGRFAISLNQFIHTISSIL